MTELSVKHCQFDKAIVLMAIRWYCAYRLSYRDIEELIAERGVHVDHSAINRWVIRFAPQLEAKMRSKKKTTAGSWSMDARVAGRAYIKVKGK